MRLTRFTLLLLALIIGLGFYLLVKRQLGAVEPPVYQVAGASMHDTAHWLAALVESDLAKGEFPAAQWSMAFNAAKNRVQPSASPAKAGFDLHAWVTDRDGMVVFHSGGSDEVGENYAAIPEVAGYLGRFDRAEAPDPLSQQRNKRIHVFAPVGDARSPIGVVCLSQSRAPLLPVIRARRTEIIWGAGLVGAGILGLLTAVYLWQYQPMSRLTSYARSIEHGSRPEMPNLGAGREVNMLAGALQSMRESLEGRQYAERYVQTLTHEMKSPLAGIRGAAELLEETMSAEDRQRFLSNIQAESLRAERLLNRLLQLSALEGRTEIEKPEKIDLTELVQQALSQAKPMAELAKVKLLVRLAKDLPTIMGDSFILRAAVTNLLENAIDFSPERGVVSVRLDSHDDELVLTIEDRGPGIPEYARTKVFERFFSLRHLNQDGRKGTGLGLTLVKEAVELHQGRVVLQDAEPTGCIMRLIFPRH